MRSDPRAFLFVCNALPNSGEVMNAEARWRWIAIPYAYTRRYSTR